MFSHLLASRPPREGKAAAAATATSVLAHAGVIALLVWATMALGSEAAETEEQVTLIEIPEETPPPPPPPPPTVEAPPPTTDVVKGFQTLTVPDVVPPEIPPPATGPEITEADFSGEGIEGGRADGKIVTANDIEAAPVFTPFTVAPELKNAAEVRRALERNYPPLLRDAGIGGSVLVWFFIDEDGRVVKTQVQKSSGHEALDAAALTVAEIMRFSPALNREMRVKVWVALPITFQAR